jgi:hypothetical protein
MASTIEPDDIRIEPLIGSFAYDVRRNFERAKADLEILEGRHDDLDMVEVEGTASLTADGEWGTIPTLKNNAGSLVAINQALASLGNRTEKLRKMQQYVDVRFYGAKLDYNPATGTGTDDTLAWRAAFAASKFVKGPACYTKVSDTITIPVGGSLVSEGNGRGNYGTEDADWAEAKTLTFVPRGMAKSNTISAMITECELSGGVLANPSAAREYTVSSEGRLAFYKLKDFTNQNASGATAATPKPFSAVLKLQRFSRLDGVAVRTATTAGKLVSRFETNYGDPVDVGILAENSYAAQVNNCSIGWAFRMYAVLHAQYDSGDGYFPQGDNFYLRNSYLEGHVSFGSRLYDYVRVSGVDQPTGEVRCKWFKSHRFPLTGSLTINDVAYAYTTLTFDSGAGDLVFGGMTLPGTGGPAVGQDMCRTVDAANYGTGGTTIRDCFIRSISHRSFRPSTDMYYTDRFDSCGWMVELSGAITRGVNFLGMNVFHGREDGGFFLNDCGDTALEGYAEAKYTTVGDLGFRVIALSYAAKVAKGVPQATGSTRAGFVSFRNWSQTESHVDRSPMFRTSTTHGRFGNDEGLFSPANGSADDYAQSNHTTETSAALIQAPGSLTADHPLLIKTPTTGAALGIVAASMDRTGRWIFGTTGADRTADLTRIMTLSNSGGGRHLAIVNTGSATATGLEIQNTAGIVNMTVEGSGVGQLASNNIGRVRWGAGFFGSAVDGVVSAGVTGNRFKDADTTEGYRVAGVKVIVAQRPAIANATDAATTMARLNDLLAAARAHGLIAT